MERKNGEAEGGWEEKGSIESHSDRSLASSLEKGESVHSSFPVTNDKLSVTCRACSCSAADALWCCRQLAAARQLQPANRIHAIKHR